MTLLQGNYGSVSAYVVSSCPQNESAWTAAARRLNCSLVKEPPFHHYYCLPTEDFSELTEFCFDKNSRGLPKGVCLKLGIGGFIRNVDCTSFTHGCPDTHFLSEDIYQYPACFQVNTEERCYLAQEKCLPPSSTSPSTSLSMTSTEALKVSDSKAGILALSISLVFLLLLMVLIIGFCIWKRGRKIIRRKKRSPDEENGKENQPSTDNKVSGHEDMTDESQPLPECQDSRREVQIRKEETPLLPTYEDMRDESQPLPECQDSRYEVQIREEETPLLPKYEDMRDESQPLPECQDSRHEVQIRKEETPLLPKYEVEMGTEETQPLTKSPENQVEGIQQAKISEEWQRENMSFYRTRACQEAERRIKSSNIFTITGNSGSGKTAIAQHIALLYQKEGYQIISADSFKNVKKRMNPHEKQVFLLNDPVGKESLDERLENNMKIHDDSTLKVLKNSKIKIIFTCRKVVLNDKKLRCKLMTSSIVDIDGEKLLLSEHEKKAILEKHIKLFKIDKKEMSEILKTQDYFPLLCYLYGKNEKYREKNGIIRFFKGFGSIIKKEIKDFKNIDKRKFCALILLSVYENGLEEELITDVSEKSPKVVEEVFELCGLERGESRSFLLDQLSTLEGSYVKKVGNLYTFLHDYMMEITTLVLGETHPKFVIQHCAGRFLRKRLEFKTTESNHMKIENQTEILFINPDEKYVTVLVDRFISEIKSGNCIDAFLSPCFRHKSVITKFISKIDDSLRKEILKLSTYKRKNQNMDEINEGVFTKLDFFFLRTKASPLHLLVIYNFESIVTAICDRTDISELHHLDLFAASCASGNMDLLKYITSKLGFNEYDKWDGNISLEIAALFNYDNITSFLLKKNISNVNCGSDGWTPLIIASGNRFENNDYNQCSVVKTLIKYKADVNARNKNGDSPLSIAAQNGHDSIVKILLDNKADVNMCDTNGVSPLSKATNMGHDPVIKVLLDNKADVNGCDINGVSPLYIAAEAGHYYVVKMLLDNKADVNMRNKNGVSPLGAAARKGHDSVVKILLHNKADVNMCNKNGVSPLGAAARKGYDSVVKILLDNKADVNMCNKNGVSPLRKAARKGHDSVVKILLDNKADVNKCDSHDVSPLYTAAQNGHDSVVKTLLDNKADVNVRRKSDGDSPLLTAVRSGHDSVVKILLDNKADVNMCDNDGFSPVNIAERNGHNSVVNILLSN